MKDIESRADVEKVVRLFYSRAIDDEVIGFIFRDIAKLDLDHHIPVITDFWEMMLLGTAKYIPSKGENPLQIHKQLDDKTEIKPEHFQRWLQIWDETVKANFAGEKADYAMLRARAIAGRMGDFITSERGKAV